ncbi:variable large family protein [Borrelia maritima]|uniref:variable large family protein n=1 Tax=Borrelia maritima TaxID=2761123 RepID=UPI00165FA9B7|nr:variable large family protein [Borrelia maritima]
MKKISSAIFLTAFIVFINCKNNAGEQAGAEGGKDSASIFYQSIIKLGNGFIDVFNAFGGLVADAFLKANPKKSDTKTYFDSITKTLKDTKEKLDKLSNEKGETNAAKDNAQATGKEISIESVVKEVGGWLAEMIKAAEEMAAKAESGNSDIVDIAGNGQGASANVENVKGIAKGIKTIVDTAKKSDAKLELKAAEGGSSNKEAGKLFAVGADADGNAMMLRLLLRRRLRLLVQLVGSRY